MVSDMEFMRREKGGMLSDIKCEQSESVDCGMLEKMGAGGWEGTCTLARKPSYICTRLVLASKRMSRNAVLSRDQSRLSALAITLDVHV